MGISADDKIVCYANHKNRKLIQTIPTSTLIFLCLLPSFRLLTSQKSVGMIRRLVDAIATADEIY